MVIGVIHRWPLGSAAMRVAGAAVTVAGFGFVWRVFA